MDKPVDERGIPTEHTGTESPYCPDKPCDLCTGISEVKHPTEERKLTSWEWCQQADTCGATVDWELIFNGR